MSPPMSGGRKTVAGLSLLMVVALTLAMELGAPKNLTWGSGGALIVFWVLVWPAMGRSARGMIAVALALAVPAVAFNRLDVIDLRDALGRSGFIAALFTCFGVLREAALTSELVRRTGRFLARRPPGQRYGALTMGGHLFGLILNFGVIPLLGTLIVEGTRAADTAPAGDADPARARRAATRRRRMAQAVHRGFVATLIWSPLTVSMAVIFSALPEIAWSACAPWLVGVAGLFLLIGWGVDRFSPVRRTTAPVPPEPDEGGSWSLLVPVVGVIALIFAGGVALEEGLGIRLVAGVMLVSPLVAAGWIVLQVLRRRSVGGALSETGARLLTHVRETFPTYHTELAVVAASAFIGLVVAAVLPPEAVPALLAWLGWPSWLVLAMVPWLAVAGGQAGMSPVLSISLLAAALPGPATLGVPGAMMAVAYGGSWALVAASSPFTASVLTSARVASSATWSTTPVRFGLRENALFTGLCALALSAVVALMALPGVVGGPG
ncbi:hypothetical protein [Pararhodospirillum oryzae]|uniref:Uncharacterized protein n=1 Tax=Pararhodospirillum oryzae TaxID=478448 RepID=A0A512H4H2_9PROT|nr:hypothetical protein [Pararhodospirillum oryzae]GEO80369.1 hypothetical protein ROR02_05000 [Pararhodospirillum oryzae]